MTKYITIPLCTIREPLTLSPQSRESFLAWNEEYQDGEYTTEPKPSYASAMSKPTHFELQKTAPILGKADVHYCTQYHINSMLTR